MANVRIKDIELFSTIGIEFTYIKNPFDETAIGDKQEALVTLSAYPHIGLDDGAIEIRTPVFRDVESLMGFYDYINHFTNRLSIEQKILCSINNEPPNYLPGGGGHINFGLVQLDEFPLTKDLDRGELRTKVLRFLGKYPSIAWVFCESHDHEVEGSLVHVHYDYSHNDRIYAEPTSLYGDVRRWETGYGQKGVSNNRIELRFFDGYKNRQDLINCIGFANNLIKLIAQKDKNGLFMTHTLFSSEGEVINYPNTDKPLELNTSTERAQNLVNGTIDDAIANFEEACELLDIDPSLFNDRIKYNLTNRFEAGDEYWVYQGCSREHDKIKEREEHSCLSVDAIIS
jgi:hypothetical protein